MDVSVGWVKEEEVGKGEKVKKLKRERRLTLACHGVVDHRRS
jgi:hypothetical protein